MSYVGDALSANNAQPQDANARDISYNYWTDRTRVELPAPTDPAASGFCYGLPFDSQMGKRGRVSSTRELACTDTVRVIGGVFGGTINALDTGMWSTPYTSGTGTYTITGGQLVMSTGITSNSSAYITTTKLARFLATTMNYFNSFIQLPDTGTANNIRRWGAFDTSEGFFFVLNGTSLSVATRKNSVDTTYAISGFSLDLKCHQYEIYWNEQYIWFYVDNNVVATITSDASPLTNTLHLKASAHNVNSGGSTTNVIINVRSMAISRIGEDISKYVYFHCGTLGTNVLKYGPGTLGMFSLNVKGATSNVVTLYDGTAVKTGTEICTLDCVNLVSAFIDFEVDYSGGLTIACSGGTPADFTVTYE